MVGGGGEQLVEGVGDEVVLFAAFLLLSLCLLLYVSLRGTRGGTRRQPAENTDHQREGGGQEELSGPAASAASASGDGEGGAVGDREEGESERQSEERHAETDSERQSGVRSRFPQAREGEEDNSEQSVLSIRLILPDNTTLPVNAHNNTTLGELRCTHFQEELADQRPVRFIYQGRVLENDSDTLQHLNIGPQHAIHVHIGRPRPPDGEGNQNLGPRPPGEMLNLSHLFLPLFGLILAICWVSMFLFPHVFTLLTKILLFALSLMYVLLTCSTSQNNRQ